jgi:hypothetical protein
MKVPSHVKIGEDIYSVHVVKKLKGGDGSCDVEKKRIDIDEEMLNTPVTNQLVNLLHEELHGVADHFQFTFMIEDRQHAKLAESIVESAARGFVMLLVDNTDFWEDALSAIRKEKEKWQRDPKRKARQKK